MPHPLAARGDIPANTPHTPERLLTRTCAAAKPAPTHPREADTAEAPGNNGHPEERQARLRSITDAARMPILDPNRDPLPTLQSIREVRLGFAPERRATIEYFYTQVLGFELWPAERQIPGGFGAGDVRRGILLQFRHDPPIEPMRRRCTLAVPSLDAVEARLKEHEQSYTRTRGFGLSDDALTLTDPTGHRLELRQLRPM